MERNQVEVFLFHAERALREIAIDFGMQFARDRRRRIDRLIETSRTALNQGDGQMIEITQADLHQALYELNREAYLYEGNSYWPEDWPERSIEDQGTGWNDDWDTVH